MIENEILIKGKKVVHHSIGSDRLLIVLSTHNQGDRYFGYASLTQNAKCDLLFLTDPNNGYYLDNDDGGTYIEIISHFLRMYSIDKCCIFGSSMAGYAALHFASKLKLHSIMSNPQVNFGVTIEHSWDDLRKSISKIENPIDLDKLFQSGFYGRNIFLIYGEHRLDIENVDILMSLPIYNSIIIRQKINNEKHGFFIKDLNHLFDIHNALIALDDQSFSR